MSMPIGVGIVIDDQIRDTRVSDEDASNNQKPQSLTDNKGTSEEKNRQDQVDNEGASTNDACQNHSDDEDTINDIIHQLEKEGIPLVKYRDIPSVDAIKHFGQVSFLLLDWKLLLVASSNEEQPDTPNPMVSPDTLQQVSHENKLSFIEEFHKRCFAPVLLFTNEGLDDIKEKLSSRNLYRGDDTDFILVKRKADLKSSKGREKVVIKTISDWFLATPVIRMIAEWNSRLLSAQSRMFNDFYTGSHMWPKVMASTFQLDDANPTEEMRQVLLRNLAGRLNGLNFGFLVDLNSPDEDFPHEAIISVLEKMTIIPDNCLPNQQYGCGDIFVSTDTNGRLYKINIRCDCDYIHSKDPELFMLNGREVPGNELSKVFNSEQGFSREISSAYLFPVNGGKCIRIQFKDFKRIKQNALRSMTRIGRLQPPYITDIRQRHAQWIQREGFASIPHEVIDRIVEKSQPEYQI